MLIEVFGSRYPIANTLRVAYMLQGQHSHKAYTEIFASIGDMTLEQQIEIVYLAFKVANPGTEFTQKQFLDYYLDNVKLNDVMDQIRYIVEGITGTEIVAAESDENEPESQGN